jgi:hypothetical protein
MEPSPWTFAPPSAEPPVQHSEIVDRRVDGAQTAAGVMATIARTFYLGLRRIVGVPAGSSGHDGKDAAPAPALAPRFLTPFQGR